MAKQQITDECEYVLYYPFSLLQLLQTDLTSIIVSSSELTFTKRGMLPLAVRKPNYILEFKEGDLDICEDPATEKTFALKNYVLRCPVKEAGDSQQPPEEGGRTLWGIFVSMSYTWGIVGFFNPQGCSCGQSRNYAIIPGSDGSASGGSISASFGGCCVGGDQPIDSCDPFSSCRDKCTAWSGLGQVDYTPVTSDSDVGFSWVATACVFSTFVEGGQECTSFGIPWPGGRNFGSAGVAPPAVPCQPPGEFGIVQGATMNVTVSVLALPGGFHDEIDDDGVWFGWQTVTAGEPFAEAVEAENFP